MTARASTAPRCATSRSDKGLIAVEAQLSDAEIDALLFLPGFSTASTVSALSGRGVGMDVVKSAITALGGRIAITSERGRGTTFTISLPLTLAVLDGMVVQVAGETLVIPLLLDHRNRNAERGRYPVLGARNQRHLHPRRLRSAV